MDTQAVLKFADELVFAKTGKHLDNLQEAILRGTVQGKKYSKIADENNCTQGHVKDVASEFWKIFSEILGEEVSKTNFRATLERLRFSNISNVGDYVQIANINICGESLHSPDVTTTRSPSSQPPYQDKAKPNLQQDLTVCEELKAILNQQFERLSAVEKKVMSCLGNQVESVSTTKLI